MNMTSTTSTVDCWFILLHPTTTITTSTPRHFANHGAQAHAVPLPSPEGCGPLRAFSLSTGGSWWEEQQGRPKEWETHQVRHGNEPRLLSWLIFTLPLTLSPTTSLACKSETEVVFLDPSTPFAPPPPTLEPPPPPSRARARRR